MEINKQLNGWSQKHCKIIRKNQDYLETVIFPLCTTRRYNFLNFKFTKNMKKKTLCLKK